MMKACLLFDPSKECAHQTKMRPSGDVGVRASGMRLWGQESIR